jgi:flavin-dependent dehydrogenase
LIDRAAAVGASLLWGAPVRRISTQGVILDDEIVRCRWIVAADGENSHVRKWAGLNGARRCVVRFGFRRHYQIEPWTDCVEIYWGPGCQIYVTPVGPREVCLAVVSRNSHLRLDQALTYFPDLKSRLKALAAEPRIFAKQLAMHVGALSPAHFARHAMLPLGRSILAAAP